MKMSNHLFGRILFIFLIITTQFLLPEEGESQKLAGETWINPVDSAEYVLIPSGSFSAKRSASSDEKSDINVENIYVAKHEVTVRQFSRFVHSTGYTTDAEKDQHQFTWRDPGFKQSLTHPVVYVSHEDTQNYADWAGVSLPTEAEWLYACAAGTTSRFYWGDTVDNTFLWHRENSSTGTKAAGSKLSNNWGLYDMVGNVWEYTLVSDSLSVPRGGSWTRCPVYQTRGGSFYEGIYHSIKPVLTAPKLVFGITPYDDDRGFRCVKRLN